MNNEVKRTLLSYIDFGFVNELGSTYFNGYLTLLQRSREISEGVYEGSRVILTKKQYIEKKNTMQVSVLKDLMGSPIIERFNK